MHKRLVVSSNLWRSHPGHGCSIVKHTIPFSSDRTNVSVFFTFRPILRRQSGKAKKERKREKGRGKKKSKEISASDARIVLPATTSFVAKFLKKGTQHVLSKSRVDRWQLRGRTLFDPPTNLPFFQRTKAPSNIILKTRASFLLSRESAENFSNV